MGQKPAWLCRVGVLPEREEQYLGPIPAGNLVIQGAGGGKNWFLIFAEGQEGADAQISVPGATQTDEPAPGGTSARGDGGSGLSEAEKGQIPDSADRAEVLYVWVDGPRVWRVVEQDGRLRLQVRRGEDRRWSGAPAAEEVLRRLVEIGGGIGGGGGETNPRRGLEGGSMHRNYLRDQAPVASVPFESGGNVAPKSSSSKKDRPGARTVPEDLGVNMVRVLEPTPITRDHLESAREDETSRRDPWAGSSSTKKGPGLESPSPLTREEVVSRQMLAARDLYAACAAYVRVLEHGAGESSVSGCRNRVLGAARKMEEASNEGDAGGVGGGIRCAGCRCGIPLTVYCDTCAERRS